MTLPEVSSHQGLHYRIDGPATAPPLLLVHALSTSLHLWDLQVPLWARHFRVVRFDLRGHGHSDAPQSTYGFNEMAADALSLMDHLHIERAAYVGLSIGGMIGQCLALQAPQRLTALVLAATSARTPPEMTKVWAQRIAEVGADGMPSQIQGSLSRWFTPEFRAAAPLTMQWFGDLIRATQPLGFTRCCEAIADLNFIEQLADVRVRTLTIAGARDPATTPAALQAIAERIPGTRSVVIEGAHLCNMEQPTVFAETVGHFVGV